MAGSDLQSKLIWGSGVEQGPQPEQGGVLGAPEVLEPVRVHLPEAGVVCSGRPPTHDVRLLSCTSYHSLHNLQPLFFPLLMLKVSCQHVTSLMLSLLLQKSVSS